MTTESSMNTGAHHLPTRHII